MPTQQAKNLERQLTGALTALWKAQGIKKKIVTLKPPVD